MNNFDGRSSLNVTNDDSGDDEVGGQPETGVVRSRRRNRSYSIMGETGDVTDGKIVV